MTGAAVVSDGRVVAVGVTVIDVSEGDVSVEDVAAYAESLMPSWGGVGRYPVKTGRAKGWVHVDTRANKSRWTG